MNIKQKLTDLSLNFSNSYIFSNYLTYREHIFKYINDSYSNASNYWIEEIEGFEYIFDASPLIILNLRKHCYHITGIHDYQYRLHHYNNSFGHINRFNNLHVLDFKHLFIPEDSRLGGFGFMTDYGLINIDTLKFYEVLIGIEKTKLFKIVDNDNIFLEIGAGWGGLAYQLLKLNQKSKYIIIDLPHTMIFSSVYLTACFPNFKIIWYGTENFQDDLINLDFNIAFIPCDAAFNLKYPDIDLCLNVASFQEMSQIQVDNYANFLSRICCKFIYSLNREKSPYNNQLISVSTALNKYFTSKNIKILDDSYTSINKKNTPKRKLTKSNSFVFPFFLKLFNFKTENKKVKTNKNDGDYSHKLWSIIE